MPETYSGSIPTRPTPGPLPNPTNLDLTIVIVTFNTCDLTLTCLESVYIHTKDLQFEVLLVDNASEDATADFVATLFPQVHIIRNDVNRGFSRGNNQGIRESRGRYIVLLNSDAR